MTVALKAEERRAAGPKSEVRELRKAGRVPGIVYGGVEDPRSISLCLKDLMKEMNRSGFFSHVFELECQGEKARVLARDVHFHPVTDIPLHIDFMRISRDARVTVAVPLKFINSDKSPGIKRGGLLNVVVQAIEISVLAESIPENIIIDLEGLQVGDAVHLDRLNLPKEWRIVHGERDNTLATIVAPSGLTEEKAEEKPA